MIPRVLDGADREGEGTPSIERSFLVLVFPGEGHKGQYAFGLITHAQAASLQSTKWKSGVEGKKACLRVVYILGGGAFWGSPIIGGGQIEIPPPGGHRPGRVGMAKHVIHINMYQGYEGRFPHPRVGKKIQGFLMIIKPGRFGLNQNSQMFFGGHPTHRPSGGRLALLEFEEAVSLLLQLRLPHPELLLHLLGRPGAVRPAPERGELVC